MSTRAAIARPYGDSWEGVYHHFDGYPSALGRTLWGLYHGHFNRDVDAQIKYLIEDHTAWSTINSSDFSQPPGFTNERATRVSGPACYCHGDRSETQERFVCTCGPDHEGEKCDPLFIEWAYVLTDKALIVVEGIVAINEATHTDTYADGRSHTRSAYRHRVVASYPWDGPEPPWEAIEETLGDDAEGLDDAGVRSAIAALSEVSA